MRSCWLAALVLLLVAALPASLDVGTVTLNFEGFPDSTVLNSQHPGLIISAGIPLNEFEFPPRSGINAAFDDGRPISFAFASPVLSLAGYFTYLTSLTLTAFNAASVQVGQAVSLFGSNLALSGDTGSAPNEFLSIVSPAGIARVTIAGDHLGGSFTLDDMTFETADAVPEPPAFSLVLTALGVLIGLRRRILPNQ